MSNPRWSDETATMVRQALSGCATARGYRLHDERDALADAALAALADAALAALADAGLLVPAGSEVTEEWAYPVVTKPGHTRWVHTWRTEAVIPGMAKRSVITGPWVEVPPSAATEVTS